jgi:PAS domain S-box-containing protein
MRTTTPLWTVRLTSSSHSTTRTIQFANPAADRQFGYLAKELIGQPAALLFEDRAAWNATRRAVLDGDAVRQPVEVKARRKEGSASYLEVSLSR